jgi:hypothetical protein
LADFEDLAAFPKAFPKGFTQSFVDVECRAFAEAIKPGESSVTMRPTMPFRRQINHYIDGLRHGPYIAAHERVVIDCCALQSPPPCRHGTDARPRVMLSVPPVSRHFHPDNLPATSA